MSTFEAEIYPRHNITNATIFVAYLITTQKES